MEEGVFVTDLLGGGLRQVATCVSARVVYSGGRVRR